MRKFVNYFRAPKTQNERRANCRVKVRGKRRWKNLLDSYDDTARSDLFDKSWKRSSKRKHQYKDK